MVRWDAFDGERDLFQTIKTSFLFYSLNTKVRWIWLHLATVNKIEIQVNRNEQREREKNLPETTRVEKGNLKSATAIESRFHSSVYLFTHRSWKNVFRIYSGNGSNHWPTESILSYVAWKHSSKLKFKSIANYSDYHVVW